MPARVGIVGGGIAGLTAALALRARGFDPVVLERAEASAASGVALLLWTTAIQRLLDLGVPVTGVGEPVVTTSVRTPEGTTLSTLPIEEWCSRGDAKSMMVRRPALIALLAGLLPDTVVRRGKRVVGYEQAPSMVHARFEDSSTESFDALIGADGLRSTIRRQLHGDGRIRVVRQPAWVGVANVPKGTLAPGHTTATLGDGERFWTAPLRDGAAFWFATGRPSSSAANEFEHLRQIFAGWHDPIPTVLANAMEQDAVRVTICDRPPLSSWGQGRVTLLGDAAHSVTPDLGQGACQAIESAVVLAEALERADAIEDGLRSYEALRRERTATVTRICQLTSLNTQLESPLLCAVRNVGIRFGLRTVARGQLEWLLGHST